MDKEFTRIVDNEREALAALAFNAKGLVITKGLAYNRNAYSKEYISDFITRWPATAFQAAKDYTQEVMKENPEFRGIVLALFTSEDDCNRFFEYQEEHALDDLD